MNRVWWMLVTFTIMYLLATVLGFATYLLLNPTAMWVSVFTIMPLISALLIWWYLKRINCSAQQSATATVKIVTVWILLSFGFDAMNYIWIVPKARHSTANWLFFVDQSPWIWLSYAVLCLSGYVAYRIHVRMEA